MMQHLHVSSSRSSSSNKQKKCPVGTFTPTGHTNTSYIIKVLTNWDITLRFSQKSDTILYARDFLHSEHTMRRQPSSVAGDSSSCGRKRQRWGGDGDSMMWRTLREESVLKNRYSLSSPSGHWPEFLRSYSGCVPQQSLGSGISIRTETHQAVCTALGDEILIETLRHLSHERTCAYFSLFPSSLLPYSIHVAFGNLSSPSQGDLRESLIISTS